MTFKALLQTSAAVGALALPGALHAQTSVAGVSTDPGPLELVVTGSRLKAPGLTSAGPLASIGAQEFTLEGTTNVETLLNRLPQVSGSNIEGQSTFGTPGIATVNLRDLGPQRTEVLIDGRRLMPGDPLTPFADLNFIPSAMVSSVEVLTGGASTAYGSDAVAGVVNFKLNRHLQGVMIDYQLSVDQHDNDNAAAQSELKAAGITVPGDKIDGLTHNLTIAAGANTPDQRGNVTGYFGYRSADPISESDRDFSACGVGTTSGTVPFNTHACVGSGTSAFGRIRSGGTGTGVSANPNGTATFVPYTTALNYNSNQETDLQRADTRYTAGLFADYALTPKTTVYGEFMFMDDQTRAQIAPAGINSNRTYTINCDNPLMSASEATALCGANAGSPNAVFSGTIAKRIVVPGFPRYYDLDHTDYRGVLGLKGDLGSGWSFDVYGQYGEVDYRDVQTNDVSVAHTQDALLVRNVNGAPTCISGNPACVPLNIFQQGEISKAAAQYILASGLQNGDVTQAVVSGTLNGDLGVYGVKSPFDTRPVTVAVGAEYRRDAIDLNSSANILAGDLAGFGSVAGAHGSTNVKEVFIETAVPLVSSRPFIRSLTLDLAYRYSDYNLSGGANTYKASLTYAVDQNISFRGGYNRAVRAPNVVELFQPDSASTAAVTDSCAGAAPTASLASCMRTGVTAAQYGKIPTCASNFCTAQLGGNATLKPEVADTYTGGVVLTPRVLPGFSLSVDYFNIDVENLIGTIPVPLIYSQCINTGNPFYCGMIKRDANGSLSTTTGFIADGNVNTGFLKTSGIDVAAAYQFDLAALGAEHWGRFALNFDGTWVRDRRISPAPGQPAYDCVGLYGPTCGAPAPKWRQNVRVSWLTPWKAVLSVDWRYIGGTGVDINAGSVFSSATAGQRDIADANVPGYSYIDLAGAIPLTERIVFRFGVNNLFDKDPPIVDNFNLSVNAQYGNGNTFPALYDTLGRTLFVGLNGKF
jgi:iron complex outermembrane receptor protein